MSDASVLQARLVGALFVERGLLTDEQLERALARQAESGEMLGEILVNEFEISRIELASVLAEQWAELEKEELEAPATGDAAAAGNGAAAIRKRIGEIFVERGFVDEQELGEALEAQKVSGQPLGEVLIERGSLSRLDLAGALAEQWAGLEKLRPPAPKTVEGWQQVAPAEHAAAAAQGATRSTEPKAPVEDLAVDPAVGEAVAALAERLAAVETQAGKTERVDELRVAVDTLTARLDELAAGQNGEDKEAAAEIAGLRAALDAASGRLEALEQRRTERPWRDELEHVAAGLAMRVDGLHVRVDEAATGAQSGLEVVLETLAELQEQIASAPSAAAETESQHADIAALEERIAAVVTASSAVDELSRRLEALEQIGAATPWRDELDVLQRRLTELQKPTTDPLEARVASLEARGSATPWRDEVVALQRRLDELAAAGSPVEALAERVGTLEASAQERPWRKELRRLAEEVGGRLDGLSETSSTGREELQQLRASLTNLSERLQQSDGVVERLAALEARGAETPWRAEVAALQRRLDELAAAGSPAEQLAERVGTLEAGAQERPWRKELRQLSDDVSGQFDRLSETSSTGRHELDELRADLAGLADRLQQSSAAWAPADHAHEELAALQAQLDALAEIPATVDGVVRRLAATEQRGAETPWREDLTRLAARVEALGADLDHAVSDEAVATLKDDLAQLRESVAAAETGTSSRLAELSARLDDVARSASEVARTGGAGATGVDRTELEHLEALVNDIRSAAREAARAASDARIHADDRADAEATGRDQLANELRGRLDALTSSFDGVVGQVGSAVDDLGAEVAGVKRDALGRDDVEQALAAGEERLIERLAAYDEAIVVLRRRLEEVAALDGVLGERLGSVEAGVARRLDEAAAALATEAASWHETLDTLSARVGGVEHHARSTPQALHELGTELKALVSRVATVESSVVSAARAGSGWTDAAAALGSRLVAVEEALAAAPAEDTVSPRLDELERRVEVEASEAGERAHTAEKTIRKGLGALTTRLDAVEGALAVPVEDAVVPRLDELEQRLQKEAARAAERARAAEEAVREGVAGLTSRLDVVEGALAVPVEDAVSPRLDELEQRLQKEASRAAERARAAEEAVHEGVAGLTSRLVAVEEALAAAPAEDTVSPRLDELERRVEVEASEAGERAHTAEKTIRKGLGALTTRLDAVEGALAVPVEDAVVPRLDELEQRLQKEAARAAERARAAEEAVREGVAGLTSRLDVVEGALAVPVEDAVSPRLEELERRLDNEVSQADERTRATEGALRDGLATLASRLAESESAYAHAGEGLRLSIERLGRAIVQTDDRIAARDEPPSFGTTDAYVAFAPTPEGYRLVAVDGSAPELGQAVSLEGHDEPLRVTRVGASPIPLDDRPCVYLDRV